MNLIDQYVQSILAHVESGRPEREELRKELVGHLEDAKREHERKGRNEQEAIRAAISDFGDAEEVGDALQKTIAPFSKPLLYVQGTLLLLYTFAIYMYGWLRFAETHWLWLLLSVLLGLFILIAGYYPSIIAKHKLLAGSLIALTIPISSLGVFVTDTSPAMIRNSGMLVWLLVFIGSLMICTMIVLRNPNWVLATKKEKRMRILLHLMNILCGIFVIGYSAILLMGMLAFGFVLPYGLIPFLLTGGWILFYVLQYRSFKKKSRIGLYLTAGLQAILLLFVLVILSKLFFI